MKKISQVVVSPVRPSTRSAALLNYALADRGSLNTKHALPCRLAVFIGNRHQFHIFKVFRLPNSATACGRFCNSYIGNGDCEGGL